MDLSVIIPATNEEAYIKKSIDSVRLQNFPAEVIVVVNGSKDNTSNIAKKNADQVLEFASALGPSGAKNAGAKAASSKVLIFLDADSYLENNVFNDIVKKYKKGDFGTVMGKSDNSKVKYRMFLSFKNICHRLGLYKGMLGGMMFCDAELFRKIGGFDIKMKVDELHDLSVRARRAGGKYLLVKTCYAVTSMRRFERVGFGRMFLYWCKVRIFQLIKKEYTHNIKYDF